MQVTYKNNSIKQICTNAESARKKHGVKMAQKIFQRITEISSIPSVEEMIQFGIGRCHKLKANRKTEYAVDLVHPFRLIFTVENEEIQIAKICEIVDYH